MASVLAAETRSRLAKLLGMVGSTHDGEALNAARMADKLVREAGVSWADTLGGAASPPPDYDTLPSHVFLCDVCLKDGHRQKLTQWELDFVASVRGFEEVSPKQRKTLRRIYEKTFAAAA